MFTSPRSARCPFTTVGRKEKTRRLDVWTRARSTRVSVLVSDSFWATERASASASLGNEGGGSGEERVSETVVVGDAVAAESGAVPGEEASDVQAERTTAARIHGRTVRPGKRRANTAVAGRG